ncbi:MAG TPA: heavy-metal-associated domain-containing protein [Nitrospirota bacterium]|nr:heavy-metal-associated domain-containing protein [Nitrospirota bacterium]
MRKLLFNVEDRVCDECALALRRYIGHMEGIESIDVEVRKIAVVFDSAKMTDEELIRITADSLEKLGHKPLEHWHVV